jgi:hypothetical protein
MDGRNILFARAIPSFIWIMRMKILCIPDTQAKPGNDFSFLTRIGNYIVDKQPDVIIHLGDLADMESLSTYDIGKKAFEGRRYTKDIDAAIEAQTALFKPLAKYQNKLVQGHRARYNPKTIILKGNHENRIERAVNNDAKLEGLISSYDLAYEEYWDEVVPFLDVKVVEGIAFSHYFVTGTAGRPAATASAQLAKKHMSCIAGHQQGLQIATAHRADGKRLTSIIAGSCYEHDEDYLGAQGNKHWRGMLMLHEVNDGQFDLMPVSLDYLKKKYD